MKISKRIRDGAALICALAASELQYRSVCDVMADADIRDYEVERVAIAAWYEAWWRTGFYCPEDYAEAEAMLRTGWTPK